MATNAIGIVMTVVLVGLAVWAASRRPYDKRVRREPRIVRFTPAGIVDLGRERRARRGGLLARVLPARRGARS